jgi:hypothetical protein
MMRTSRIAKASQKQAMTTASTRRKITDRSTFNKWVEELPRDDPRSEESQGQTIVSNEPRGEDLAAIKIAARIFNGESGYAFAVGLGAANQRGEAIELQEKRFERIGVDRGERVAEGAGIIRDVQRFTVGKNDAACGVETAERKKCIGIESVAFKEVAIERWA